MNHGYDQNSFNSERKERLGLEKDDPKIAGMYDLGKTIGIGHFAVVKLARHVFTNEKVAVKVIDKQRLDELSRDHLFQEVVCMKLVKHPNIVRLYHIIDTTTKLYLILELGDGGDLYDYISKHPNGINEKSAKIYFRQIVNAIAYCHKLHVVHRDLKPENVVFFEKEGTLKLTDFGFSNQFIPGNKLDTSCGSLAYSAPEILLGMPYDAPKVDIWSLGVILFMLVVGRLPFLEKTDGETLSKIMDCSFEMPETMSVDCKNLIRRLLVKDPSCRASLDEILSDPWVMSENQLFNDLYSEPLISKNELSYEDHIEILNRMHEGGIATIEEIQSNLDHDEYNHLTATYYLLAERKLKRQCDDLLRFNLLQQAITDVELSSPSDESTNVSRNNSVTPAQNVNVADLANRRFSMIREDEEYADDSSEENSKKTASRFGDHMLFHNPLSLSGNHLMEEDEEFINEEAEEMETVMSLAHFRSEFPIILSKTSCSTSNFRSEKSDLHRGNDERNSKSLPPSTLANLVGHTMAKKTLKKDSTTAFLELRRMVKTKSSPLLNSHWNFGGYRGSAVINQSNPSDDDGNRNSLLDCNRNPRIEATRSIDDAYIPTLRNPRVRYGRPGSMFNYPCFAYTQHSRNERKRRSSVASPIGVDAESSHISLREIQRSRYYPNSALSFNPISLNVQRFIEKRRSVPHNLYRSFMGNFISSVSNNRMSSRYSKISTKSLSSSETPSDSENNNNNISILTMTSPNQNAIECQKLIKSITDRRRGSSETVQLASNKALNRKQCHNFLFPHQNGNGVSVNDWYNSAPSLLNIESIDKLNSSHQQQSNHQSPLPSQANVGILNVGSTQVTGPPLREFCEPIREEEDETTKSILALNSSTNTPDKRKPCREEKLTKTFSQGRFFTGNEIRTFSSYYPTSIYSARESVVNQLPLNWSMLSEDPPNHRGNSNDAETRSVSGYYYQTRKYYFSKGNSRLTTGALSPQLTPNISLSSLASSLRQSRHMLDVIRGTFELQQLNNQQQSNLQMASHQNNQQHHSNSKATSNKKPTIDSDNYSPENSLELNSRKSLTHHSHGNENQNKVKGKKKKTFEFYSSFSDEEFLAPRNGPGIAPSTSKDHQRQLAGISKPSSDNSYNVSLLNESLDDERNSNPSNLVIVKDSKKKRKKKMILSKSDNRLTNKIVTSRKYIFKMKTPSLNSSTRRNSHKSLVIKTNKNYLTHSRTDEMMEKSPTSPKHNASSNEGSKQAFKGFRFFCCHR